MYSQRAMVMRVLSGKTDVESGRVRMVIWKAVSESRALRIEEPTVPAA